MDIIQISFVILNIEFANAHLDLRRRVILIVFVRTSLVCKIDPAFTPSVYSSVRQPYLSNIVESIWMIFLVLQPIKSKKSRTHSCRLAPRRLAVWNWNCHESEHDQTTRQTKLTLILLLNLKHVSRIIYSPCRTIVICCSVSWSSYIKNYHFAFFEDEKCKDGLPHRKGSVAQ